MTKKKRAKAPEAAAVTATTPNEAPSAPPAPMEGATTEATEATPSLPPTTDGLAAALAEDPNDEALAALLAKGDAVANAAEALKPPEEKADGEKKEGFALVRRSTTEKPCKRVWAIAEANPTLGRKATIQKCLDEGIAFYTARTQYQQWAAMRKEMAQREAAKNAPPPVPAKA